MKRSIVAILISALTILVGCFYYFDVLNNVTFLANIYANFTSFANSLKSSMSFLSSLKSNLVFVIFLALCLLVFLAIFLLITGLVAHSQKKKRKALEEKENTIDEQKQIATNQSLPFGQLPPNGIPVAAGGYIAPGGPVGYQQSATQLSEAELDREFDWKYYTGGKPVVRTIVSIILGVFFVFLILLRFFWILRVDNNNLGISFLNPIIRVTFINNFMKGLDTISDNLLHGLGPNPANPADNFVVGDVLNGNTIYIQDTIDLLLLLVVAFLVIIFYLIIATFACWLLRKPNAKKRAALAKEQYLEDLKNGKAAPISKNMGTGNTYIYYYGTGGVAPAAPVSQPPLIFEPPTSFNAPETPPEEVVPIEDNNTKSEKLRGGSNFSGGDIKMIAELDTLEENISTNEDNLIVSSYIDDIGEGVKEVALVEGEPLTEREDLLEDRKEFVESEDYEEADLSSIAVIASTPQVIANKKFELEEADVKSIALLRSEAEDEDLGEPIALITFDEDGFAVEYDPTFTSGDITLVGEEEEEVPDVINLNSALDDSDLIAKKNKLTLIIEPDFELLDKTKIINPEFAVALLIAPELMVHYLDITELEKSDVTSQDYVSCRDCLYEYVPLEDVIVDVPKNKPEEFIPNEFEEELLSKIAPEPLDVVDPALWPKEDTEIEDVGGLHIFLDSDDKSIEFDRTRRTNYLAPEIYELDEEEVVEEPVVEEAVVEKPKPIPSGLKPLHEIKSRETPKIVPLAVKPKEEVEEETEKVLSPIAGPLHEITEKSQKKDIKPVAISKDLKFNLKRFQVNTYRGNLSAAEAFERGVTKVAPVVNPVVKGAARDTEVPEWMKSVKKRQASLEGTDNVAIKHADEIQSVWTVNTKSDVVDKINDFSLRRRRNTKVEEEVEVKKNDIVVNKPVAPIKLAKPISSVETKVEEEKKVEPIIAKPLAPIHKPMSNKPKPTAIKPIKPISIKPKDEPKSE